MATPSVTKQPSESRLYSMDFAALLLASETLSTISSVTVDKTTSPVLVTSSQSVSGTIAQVRLSGGLGGVKYKVTFVVTTSAGNTLEGEGYVNVEDI